MTERLRPVTTKEKKPQEIEVRLAKDLTNAWEFAERTGGRLISQGNIPWTIMYTNGNILWAGYPNKQPQKYEATPFLTLTRKSQKHINGWIGVDAVILKKNSATLVSHGLDDDGIIFGCTFSKGKISEFEIPVSKATKNHLEAREMARRELQRFMTP